MASSIWEMEEEKKEQIRQERGSVKLITEVNNSVSTNISNLLDLSTISYLSHNTFSQTKIKTQLKVNRMQPLQRVKSHNVKF